MNKTILLISFLFISFFAASQNIKTGIEVLKASDFKILKGKHIGLITNQTGVDNQLKSTIDILHESKNVQLAALFAPEHGVRGNVYAGDKVDNRIDSKTGLPVYSLYGKTSKPTPEMLKGIDALVYDIQDIGCRSYTYISTMGLAMQAAAENNIEFIVLDRPNPLGGEKIEGNIVEEGFFSFVSRFRIPYIYGQTCGELATMFNQEKMLGKPCKLTVVTMEGWTRNMTWEDTGLPWVMTSPHIPHMQTTAFYPMTGILGELGMLSIGVGYTVPFELAGAPWINAEELLNAMNQLKLPGLEFRPIYYKPFYGTFQGEACEGVQIYIRDYKQADLSLIQFYVMQELHKLYPEKMNLSAAGKSRLDMFDKVCGTNKIRMEFEKNYQVNDIKDIWNKDQKQYKTLSEKYYLYK